MNKIRFFSLMLVVSCSFFSLVIQAQEIVPDILILNFKEELGDVSIQLKDGIVSIGISSIDERFKKYGVIHMERLFPSSVSPELGSNLIDLTRYFRIKTTSQYSIDFMIEDLNKNLLIESVEPTMIMPLDLNPDDTYFSSQWGLTKIQAPQAWEITSGNEEVKLAIVDTGVDWNHPDLGGGSPYTDGNIWINWIEWNGTSGIDDDGNGFVDDIRGWDWVNGVSGWPGEDVVTPDNDPIDFDGHGTHVAGIAGAITNNTTGVSGVAGGWYNTTKGTKIMSLRAGWKGSDGLGYVRMDFCAEAIDYARIMGATAINCSWGSVNSGGLGVAVTNAINAGILIVKSAGNSDTETPDYLNGRGDCLSVADTDQNDVKANLGSGRINAYTAVLETLAELASENKSVDQTATAYNNGRRIVRDGASYWHLVFASGGHIFYRKRTPWGQWQTPIRISSAGSNDFPCITLTNNGDLFAVWQRKIGTNTYDIYFAMSRDNGTNWQQNDTYILRTVDVNSDPLPVIQADYDGIQKIVVIRIGNGFSTYKSLATYPTLYNWQQLYIITNSDESFPTLADEGYFSKTTLAYQHPPGQIWYQYHNGSTWNYPVVILSNIIPGSGVHLSPSITNIPGSSQIHVAWKKLIGSGSSIYDHLIVHRRATNYYTWPNEWFGTYYNQQEHPSISGIATNKVDLLFQTPPQFGNPYVYRMRFTGNYWGSPIYIGNNARYPSVSSGSTTANYVWTSGSTAPYTVSIGSGLSKETEAEPRDYYSRSISLLDSSGNYIELKIYSLGFRLNDGTIKRMDYSREDLSSFNLTNTNAWDSLCITSLKVIPKQVSELLLDYSIEAKNISSVANINNDLTVEFNILDSRNNLLTSKPQNHSAVSNQINLIRKALTIPINSINYTPLVTNIRASIKVKNITPKFGTFASLGHIFDYTSLASNDKTEDENTIIEAEVIKDLTIQNYPNPFNPITNITYTLPYQSSIKLVIYDIMGGEVKTFNIASQSPGYQTIIWDGRNEMGNSVSSGIYIYRISVKSLENNKTLVKTSKLMMLK